MQFVRNLAVPIIVCWQAGNAQAETSAELASQLRAWNWSGPVAQSTSRPYTIQVVPSGTGFQIDYPELPCTATWAVENVAGTRITVNEVSTSGRCFGGTVFVDGAVGELSYQISWSFPSGKHCCSATITPTGPSALVSNLSTEVGNESIDPFLSELTIAQHESLDRNLEGIRNATTLWSFFAAAREIASLIELYDDAARAQEFIFKHLIPSTGLSDAEALFTRKAQLSIYKSSVKILAELFLESMLQSAVLKYSPIDLEENVAESVTKSIINLATADLSGQIMDQALLLAEAFTEIQKQNNAIVKNIETSTEYSVESLRLGDQSPEEFLATTSYTKDLAEELTTNSLLLNKDAAIKVFILAAMADIAAAEISMEKFVRSDNLYHEQRELKVAQLRAALIGFSSTGYGSPLSPTYFNYADTVAARLSVASW